MTNKWLSAGVNRMLTQEQSVNTALQVSNTLLQCQTNTRRFFLYGVAVNLLLDTKTASLKIDIYKAFLYRIVHRREIYGKSPSYIRDLIQPYVPAHDHLCSACGTCWK